MTDVFVLFRDVRVARRKRPGSTLPMHTNTDRLAVYLMLFDLCNVMSNVIDKLHTKILRRFQKHLPKDLPSPVHDYLPVSPSIICCCSHSCKIILPLLRSKRSTCQLPVGNINVVFPDRALHDFQVISTHLMAQSPGTGMNHDNNLTREKP